MYLIHRELPKEFAASYRWSLVAMKIGDGSDSRDPYVAFESASAASEFITALPAVAAYSSIESSCIGLDTYLDPNASALLFSSVEHLNRYRSDGTEADIPRVPIVARSAFERIVRKVKDRYAAWHIRKFAP
jgi:hypothetical protein